MASHDDRAGFRVYASLSAIPWYQRAWIWGSAALLILFCGLLIGWLVKPEAEAVNGALASQEATNQHLRDEIARLEALMSTDICRGDAVPPPRP